MFLAAHLSAFSAEDMKGLCAYSRHCLLNGKPVDLTSSAHIVSDWMIASQKVPLLNPI